MEVLTAKEAANMLEVSVRQLERIVKSGRLIRRDGGYDPNEVAALQHIRKNKVDLPDLAIMAQQAHMEAFRVRRELTQIKELLGINLPHIKLNAEFVESLHTRVEGLTLMLTPFQAKEIVEWSRIFLALGEEYFEAVTLYLHIKEPWWVYLELAEMMQRSATPERCKSSLEMRMAHDYLASCRPGLRNAAFSRAHQVYGRRGSLKLFPDMMGRGHQSVLQIIDTLASEKRKAQKRR